MTASTLSFADLGPSAGDAVFLGDFPSNSPGWHALRANGIGGSEVGTICGVNPWESPFTLWAKKTGRIERDFEPSEAMEWGTRLESVILEKFADVHPELTVFPSPGTFCHKDREWQIANLDGVFVDAAGNPGIIEIKTARYEDDWIDGVPPYYKTQVQWYLQTFGYGRAIVAVLFSGSKYREFEILADEFEQQINLKKVEEFRTYVADDIKPDFDGALSTYETVRKIHPQIDSELEIELGQLAVDYIAASMIFAEADRNFTELKSRVLDAMGNAKKATLDGNVFVTRQARGTGTPYLVNKKL